MTRFVASLLAVALSLFSLGAASVLITVGTWRNGEAAHPLWVLIVLITCATAHFAIWRALQAAVATGGYRP
jgi:hypothetical protein